MGLCVLYVQRHDTQHNDINYNDTKHEVHKFDTHKMLYRVSHFIVILSVVILNGVAPSVVIQRVVCTDFNISKTTQPRVVSFFSNH